MTVPNVSEDTVIDPTTWGNIVANELNDRGIKAVASVTSGNTAFDVGGSVDIVGLSLNVTTKADRYYRVKAELYYYVLGSGSESVGNISIIDSIAGQIQSSQVFVPGAGTSNAVKVTAEVIAIFGAGTRTIKVVGQKMTGTGTISTLSSTNAAMQLYVEDVGPV